jgi:hypothetical protein
VSERGSIGLSPIVTQPDAQAKTAVLPRSYDDGGSGSNLTETRTMPDIVATRQLKRVKTLVIGDHSRIAA